jgi:RNA polymerase sigma-70 factor (ECF subfamily)
MEPLAAAQQGDEDAFRRLLEPFGRFEGRSSLRSWLYTIATNTCLNQIARRPKRVLPLDYGPSTDARTHGVGEPLIESVWVEPYPDERFGVEDGLAAPDARYERRESVELAFIAAVQHLPATQRAVLILRDVLGFSAREVAESLDTTVASANSALQRARKTVDDRFPEQSQQTTLRALGDQKLRGVVEGYMDAMERGDVEAVVAMLAEDAAWSMPPLSAWFAGAERIRGFLVVGPLSGEFRWRHLPARVNGQAASAAYSWIEAEQAYLPFALDVLTLEGDRIKAITSFISRATLGRDPEYYARFPDQPRDLESAASFERFGLPARLDPAR